MVLGDELINNTRTYTPHIGLHENAKVNSGTHRRVTSGIDRSEETLIGGDLNSQIGRDCREYHRGFIKT